VKSTTTAATVSVTKFPTSMVYRWPLAPLAERLPVFQVRWTERGDMVTSFIPHAEGSERPRSND
jgi:hypothetical protein